MFKNKPSNYKWTKEKCKEEALKYNHKIDFKKNSKGAYPSALKNGWIDEICLHMTPVGNEYKRLIYRFIFPDNYCYIGLTCNSSQRKNQHLKKSNSSVYNHILKTNLEPIYEELTNYINVDDSKIQEEFWKLKSEEQGYLILNKSKTGALGGKIIKWTFEKCKEESLKYSTITDFKLKSSSAYNSSHKHNWIKDITNHMTSTHKNHNYWTLERCKNESLKYNTRYGYSLGSKGSYDSARRNGWLNDICSHMIELRKPKGYWTLEKCKNELLKYNSLQELKIHNSYVYYILLKNNIKK